MKFQNDRNCPKRICWQFYRFFVCLQFAGCNCWENRKTCQIKYQLDTICYRHVMHVEIIRALLYERVHGQNQNLTKKKKTIIVKTVRPSLCLESNISRSNEYLVNFSNSIFFFFRIEWIYIPCTPFTIVLGTV